MAAPGITAEAFSRHHFDYIIIGGGTAGLAVAARLSEHPGLRVGVLEAGPDALDDEQVNVPGWFGSTMGSALDWRMETVPQPGLGGRRVPWARGKVLGGTSALNFMGWNRASRQDYDAWAELGCTGWGWDDLLPYFKKSEGFHPPSQETQERHKAYYDADSLGTSGPVQVSYGAEFSASHQHWHETWANLGVATNRAHLAGSNVGAYTKVASVDPADRTRSYSATAYYRPARHRPNLVVLTEALVERVVLEREGGGGGEGGRWVATGVHFTTASQDDDNDDDENGNYDNDKKNNKRSYHVSAAKEVILCAGSTQSPQVLELSGVGAPAVLARAGVPTRVASPHVGENLQDHVMAASTYEVDGALPTRDDLRRDEASARAAREAYAASRSGPLTVLANSVCYLPFDQVMPGAALAGLRARVRALGPCWDDDGLRDEILWRRFETSTTTTAGAGPSREKVGQMEYFFELGTISPFFKGDHQTSNNEGHEEEEEENGDKKNNNSSKKEKKKYGTVLQILQFPFSKGSVHIWSPDPRDHPAIDPRYYQGPGGEVDLDAMVASARFADEVTRTPPLAGIVRGRVAPPASARSDAELRDWLIRETITDWHPVGTCSMGGRRGIAGGVVDERLRVYGVGRLRVVDASIMPLQISAHPQATVYAIAEKGAQMILEDQGVV